MRHLNDLDERREKQVMIDVAIFDAKTTYRW